MPTGWGSGRGAWGGDEGVEESGSAAGREVPLIKVVTTIGKPGVAVAAITRRPHGYVVAMVEGTVKPTINGNPLSTEGIELHHGDLLELAGTQMQFVQQ